MILPEKDIKVVLYHVEEAIWIQAEEEGMEEDDAIEISDAVCAEVNSILTQDLRA